MSPEAKGALIKAVVSALAAIGLLAMIVALSGCAVGARTNLAAADALDALSPQIQLALDEYHEDLDNADESSRNQVVGAFVARIQRDHDDEAATAEHVAKFAAALNKIEADRDTARARHTAASDNVKALGEIAGGLRRLGIDALSLDDEVQRYVVDLIGKTKEAEKRRAAEKAQRDAMKTQTRNALISGFMGQVGVQDRPGGTEGRALGPAGQPR